MPTVNDATNSKLILAPGSTQPLTATSTIAPKSGLIPISASSAIASFTSTPLIAAGVAGQQLELINIGTTNIGLSDYTNSGTNLGVAITLLPQDTLQLAYLLQSSGGYSWQAVGGSAYVRAISALSLSSISAAAVSYSPNDTNTATNVQQAITRCLPSLSPLISGTFTLGLSNNQTVTASSTISSLLAAIIPITAANTIAAFTSTPLIGLGNAGQQIELVNIGTKNITLSDYANSGTNLGLSITLLPQDALQLVCLPTVAGGYSWQAVGGSAYVRAIASSFSGSGSGVVDTGLAEGRLTLTSAIPVLSSDVTGASTIYYTPYKGDRITLWNGTIWATYACPEISISISSVAANTVFDIFCYLNGSTPTLELLAWTNITTRAAALTRQNGVLTKSGDATRRFLGTGCTFGTAGQTQCTFGSAFVSGGSNPKWGISNYQNTEQFTVYDYEGTSSWTYGTNVWRAANNSTNNRFTLVNAVFRPVISSLSLLISPGSGVQGYGGIALDTSSNANIFCVFGGGTGYAAFIPAVGTIFVNPGQHYLQATELSSGSSSTTYYGNGDWVMNFNFSA